jgi:hypothetical protein
MKALMLFPVCRLMRELPLISGFALRPSLLPGERGDGSRSLCPST